MNTNETPTPEMKMKMKSRFLDFSVTVSVPFTCAGWPDEGDWNSRVFLQIMTICVAAADGLCTGTAVQWCDGFAVSRPTVTIRGPVHEVAAKSFAFFDGVFKYLRTLPYDMEISAKFRSLDNSAFTWKNVGLPPVRTRL